ncbi:MAG: YihA family ribosome biogenesis GTP-binding protein, partial [Lactococcus cremoris]
MTINTNNLTITISAASKKQYP